MPALRPQGQSPPRNPRDPLPDVQPLGAGSLFSDRALPGCSAGAIAERRDRVPPPHSTSLPRCPEACPCREREQSVPVEEAGYQPATLGSAGTALALQDPAHAAYVIVPETDAPHSTLASAQDLPNLPYFGVIGTLGSGNSIDFYQMTIGAAAAGIQFELVAQQPAASTPVQLSLYDASGRVLGTWTSGPRPQPDGSPLRLDLPSQSPGSTLYLGISAPSSSGDGLAGSATTTDYQLWVARSTAPDRPLTTGTADGAATVRKRVLDAHPGPFPTFDHSFSEPASSSSRSDFQPQQEQEPDWRWPPDRCRRVRPVLWAA